MVKKIKVKELTLPGGSLPLTEFLNRFLETGCAYQITLNGGSVKDGDRVKKGDVVCAQHVMKAGMA